MEKGDNRHPLHKLRFMKNILYPRKAVNATDSTPSWNTMTDRPPIPPLRPSTDRKEEPTYIEMDQINVTVTTPPATTTVAPNVNGRPHMRCTAPNINEMIDALNELHVTRPELFHDSVHQDSELYGNVSMKELHSLGVPLPRSGVSVPVRRHSRQVQRPPTPFPRSGHSSHDESIQNDRFDWLKAAGDYRTCGQYTPPDTCRYAGADDYRCTMPVGTTTALIIRTMRIYGIPFRMLLVDRGTFGLHLDVTIRSQNMPQLIGLFTMEDLRLIAHNLEAEENAIYNAFKTEIGISYDPPPARYDRRRQLGRIMARVTQEDAFESGEIYLTSARTEETVQRTRPFTQFLRRLHGFGPEHLFPGNVPPHGEKPILARGPRDVTRRAKGYDRLRLKRQHQSERRNNLRAESQYAELPTSSSTTPAPVKWHESAQKTWF